MTNEFAYDLEDLAVDVFAITAENAVIESITGAHGLTESAASCITRSFCSGSCSFTPVNP